MPFCRVCLVGFARRLVEHPFINRCLCPWSLAYTQRIPPTYDAKSELVCVFVFSFFPVHSHKLMYAPMCVCIYIYARLKASVQIKAHEFFFKILFYTLLLNKCSIVTYTTIHKEYYSPKLEERTHSVLWYRTLLVPERWNLLRSQISNR